MYLGLKDLDTPKTAASFFCMLFFGVLPFTTLAVSVNGKTSKKACKNDAAVFGVSRPLGCVQY